MEKKYLVFYQGEHIFFDTKEEKDTFLKTKKAWECLVYKRLISSWA